MRGDFGAAVDAYLDAVTAPLSWPHDPAWKLHEPQLAAGVRRELEARLAAHPDDPDLRYVEARLLEDLGDLRAALRAFEGIEQAAPGHLHTRSKIGSLLASLGGSLASIAAADRAIERLDRALPTADAGRALFGPDGPDGVRTPGVADFVEGRLFARDGRHADAIRAFERLLAGHRDEPLVWEHLHRSHEALAGRAGADAAIRGLLAAGTPPQRPLRIPPARPVPIGPPTGSEASIPVVLAIDGFATADPRHRHAQTVWRVRHVDDDIRLAPRIEVLAEPGLRLEIPDGMLVPGETYAWSAAFVLDGQGIASADCDEQLFVAPRGGASPTPIDLSPHFDRDVIANPGDETGDPFDPPNSYLLVVDGFDGVGLGDPRVAGLPADGRVGPHRLGPYEGPNCARFGSTFRHEVRIDVPRGRYRSFLLLGASGNGTTSTWVRIVYADETVDHVQCVFPDWFSTGMSAAIGPQSLPQPVRRGMDRWSVGGVEQRDAAQVFEMFVAADPDREVVELRLLGESTRFDRPDTTLNLLAITGMRVGAAR
jgi:tetratricopeptide (TPR) repeat protein